MPLHRTKQKILRAIAEGYKSEPALADHLGAILDVMRYHLESLEEDEYIKCRRGAPTETTSDRLFIYEIWLTAKGETTVEELPENLSAMSEPVPLASVPMNVSPATSKSESELADEAILKKAVAEIQKRIQQLYSKYPAEKTSEQYQLTARILHYVESNQVLKDYAIAAAQKQLLKPLTKTPVGQLVIGAIESWLAAAN